MRYRLRTLVIVLTLAPPLLAAVWWAWSWSAANTNGLRVLAPVVTVPIVVIVYAVARIVAVVNRKDDAI